MYITVSFTKVQRKKKLLCSVGNLLSFLEKEFRIMALWRCSCTHTLALSLSLCLPASFLSAPPTHRHFFFFFGQFSHRCHRDCDAESPNWLPVCSDMSSVCGWKKTKDKKHQGSLCWKRKCLDNYVISSFILCVHLFFNKTECRIESTVVRFTSRIFRLFWFDRRIQFPNSVRQSGVKWGAFLCAKFPLKM